MPYLVECRQHRCRVLSLDETLGDARTQPRHRHALLCARDTEFRRRGGSRHRHLFVTVTCARTALEIIQDIGLSHATFAPRAGDRSRIQIVLLDEPARSRTETLG